MINRKRVEDIKTELAALQSQEPDAYWPQWEKDRDIDRLLTELNRELSR